MSQSGLTYLGTPEGRRSIGNDFLKQVWDLNPHLARDRGEIAVSMKERPLAYFRGYVDAATTNGQIQAREAMLAISALGLALFGDVPALRILGPLLTEEYLSSTLKLICFLLPTRDLAPPGSPAWVREGGSWVVSTAEKIVFDPVEWTFKRAEESFFAPAPSKTPIHR
jgi:hypothetical protein